MLALVRLDLGVSPLVVISVAASREALATDLALKQSFAAMHAHVLYQVASLVEFPLTWLSCALIHPVTQELALTIVSWATSRLQKIQSIPCRYLPPF